MYSHNFIADMVLSAYHVMFRFICSIGVFLFTFWSLRVSFCWQVYPVDEPSRRLFWSGRIRVHHFDHSSWFGSVQGCQDPGVSVSCCKWWQVNDLASGPARHYRGRQGRQGTGAAGDRRGKDVRPDSDRSRRAQAARPQADHREGAGGLRHPAQRAAAQHLLQAQGQGRAQPDLHGAPALAPYAHPTDAQRFRCPSRSWTWRRWRASCPNTASTTPTSRSSTTRRPRTWSTWWRATASTSPASTCWTRSTRFRSRCHPPHFTSGLGASIADRAQELDIIYKIPHCVPISAHHKWNFDDLLEKMWTYLDLLRMCALFRLLSRALIGAPFRYTKPKGQLPDYNAPIVVPAEAHSVEDLCNKIHKNLLKEIK